MSAESFPLGSSLSRSQQAIDTRRQLAVQLLRTAVRSLGWKYSFYIAMILTLGAASLLPPELMKYFTQSTQKLSEVSSQDFVMSLLFFGAMTALLLFVASLLRVVLEEWLRLRLEAELRRRVMQRLQEVPLAQLDGIQRGDWFTRVTADLDHAELFLTDSLPNQLRQIGILLGSTVLFVQASGWLAAIPLVTAGLMAFINLYLQGRLSPALAELRSLHGGVFQLLIETLEGIRTIRSHSAEAYVQRRFETKQSELVEKSKQAIRYLGRLSGGNELATQLMVTICLCVVGWALTRETITIHQALVFPFFINVFYGAAQGLASGTYDWNRFFIEGGRLAEVIFNGAKERLQPLELNQSFLNTHAVRISNFEYGHQGIFNVGPVNLTFSRSSLWAIMGPSGCGKSTFLEILAGLRPADSGEVKFLTDSAQMLWQQRGLNGLKLPIGPCAYVEQHPYLFEGSLRENLTFGNSIRHSDAVLWKCLERVSLQEFAQLRGGLDFRLTDRGRNLSEGERYRIALGRALLLERPFLLLDEPFAALDSASVQSVVQTLTEEKHHGGVILVTHFLPKGLEVDGLWNFEAPAQEVPATKREHERYNASWVSEMVMRPREKTFQET